VLCERSGYGHRVRATGHRPYARRSDAGRHQRPRTGRGASWKASTTVPAAGGDGKFAISRGLGYHACARWA